MSGTSDLRSEHGGVRTMLDVLDVWTRSLRAGDAVPADEYAQAVDFLRVFVDQCHHAKEEQYLFPALERQGLEQMGGVVRQLQDDHVRGRALTGRIAELAVAVPQGSGDPIDLAEAIDDYTGLLRDHIRREEADCFDTADRVLPPDVQAELVQGYDRIEREVVGEGRHEAFHAMLDLMSAEYLTTV